MRNRALTILTLAVLLSACDRGRIPTAPDRVVGVLRKCSVAVPNSPEFTDDACNSNSAINKWKQITVRTASGMTYTPRSATG